MDQIERLRCQGKLRVEEVASMVRWEWVAVVQEVEMLGGGNCSNEGRLVAKPPCTPVYIETEGN